MFTENNSFYVGCLRRHPTDEKKMKKYYIFICFIFVAGCGTILDEREQTVFIDSDPVGMNIFQGENWLGKTPLELKLKRSDRNIYFQAEKEGYKKRLFFLESSYSKWAILDTLASSSVVGTTSLSVDGLTGMLWEYFPNHFFIKGQKEKALSDDNEVSQFVINNFCLLKKNAAEHKGEALETLEKITGKNKNTLCKILELSSSPSDALSVLESKNN